MKYAKLINQYPQFAPNPILHNGLWYGNPPGSMYEEQGYKPVVYTDIPGEAPVGYRWEETWTENENIIQQVWVLVEETDVDPSVAIDYLFGGDSE